MNKLNFQIYIVAGKQYYLSSKLFRFCCVNVAVLPLVRCYAFASRAIGSSVRVLNNINFNYNNNKLDNLLRSAVTQICNVSLSDDQWTQNREVESKMTPRFRAEEVGVIMTLDTSASSDFAALYKLFYLFIYLLT